MGAPLDQHAPFELHVEFCVFLLNPQDLQTIAVFQAEDGTSYRHCEVAKHQVSLIVLG